MAYTQTDLDSIDQALLDLALGRRQTSITIDGDRIDLAAVSAAELRDLRAVVAAGVSTTFAPRVYAKNGGRG